MPGRFAGGDSGGSPIGVFDSGVGGLTVLRALVAALPAEDFIYLGDTARLPYGTKSAETVVRYSLQCAAALVARGIGSLVVACNTASASALGALTQRYPSLPIIGVIEPGAAAAVAASNSQHIAVIGTEGTISGGAYQTAIQRLRPAARITACACSMFVALAEEGWTGGAVAEAVARRYLEPLFRVPDAPDTLLLGCTHFPILAAAIRSALPAHVRIVEPAAAVAAAAAAAAAAAVLKGSAASGRAARSQVTWLATDGRERFARVGSTFFGRPLHAQAIEIIDL